MYICNNCGRHNTIKPEICSNCRVNAGFQIRRRPRSLNEIGAESLKTSEEKGFDTVEPSDWHIQGEPDIWQRLLVPTKLALIHSEVSEALEEFRKGHNLEAFAGELADIIIRVGQLGVGLGIDLDAAVAAKQEKNRNREHQHGGRLI